MSVADLQELEEVKLLVVKGQATGVLTYAEVALALAEVELDEGDIEELHGYFEKSEIELVEDDPTHSAPEVERAVDRRSRRKKATIDLKPDMTTDSLQLFLKDIGKVRCSRRRRRSTSPSASSAATSRSRRWSSRTCAWSSRSRRTTATRACLPRPDPGGDARPRSRRREVRLPQGLQVLDLRHLVDPPGDRPRARRQGAHDPHPGPRGREAQQDRPCRAQARHGARPRADAEEIAEHTGIEPEEVESIKRSAQAPVSLEKPVGDEEVEFGQFIADERAESPYERAAEIPRRRLSARRSRTSPTASGACSSCWLGGEHPRTLDEVGRTFNVTRERIRQIENQSLKKPVARRRRRSSATSRVGQHRAVPSAQRAWVRTGYGGQTSWKGASNRASALKPGARMSVHRLCSTSTLPS